MATPARIVIRLAAACAALALCASAPVAAAASAALTATEYRQLSTATAALDRAASSRSIDWAGARTACRRVSHGTALLRTERASCLDTIAVLDAVASFPAEQHSCSARVRTTNATGSTTPANSAMVRVMVCMSPRYQALSRRARTMYGAEVAARNQALARGFTGACLVSLAPTSTELRTVRRFSQASTRLAADVVLLIRLTRGSAPISAFHQARIDRDVVRFETSATAVLADRNRQNVSSCPHA